MSEEINQFDATLNENLENFMEAYKMVDVDEIYSNGTEFVPIFRVKQWLDYNNIKNLQQKVEQLENIRKEAIEYINHATIGADSSPIEDSWLYNLYETRHILNKGDNKE